MAQDGTVKYTYKRRIPEHVQNTLVTPGYKLDYTKSWLAAEGSRAAHADGSMTDSTGPDEDALHLNSIADYTAPSTLSSSVSNNQVLLPRVQNTQRAGNLSVRESFGEKLQAFLAQYGEERRMATRNGKRAMNSRQQNRKLGSIVSSQRLGQLLNNNLPLSLNNFYTAQNK